MKVKGANKEVELLNPSHLQATFFHIYVRSTQGRPCDSNAWRRRGSNGEGAGKRDGGSTTAWWRRDENVHAETRWLGWSSWWLGFDCLGAVARPKTRKKKGAAEVLGVVLGLFWMCLGTVLGVERSDYGGPMDTGDDFLVTSGLVVKGIMWLWKWFQRFHFGGVGDGGR